MAEIVGIVRRREQRPASVDQQSHFKDCSGHAVPYQTLPVAQEDVAELGRLACEIDPHTVGQWAVWGRGRTAEAAVQRAVASWNSFDKGTR